QREVVGDAVGDGSTPGTGDHLLLRELVEVPADRRLRDVEPVGGLLDTDPSSLGEQFEERVPAGIPVHRSLHARTVTDACTVMRETGRMQNGGGAKGRQTRPGVCDLCEQSCRMTLEIGRASCRERG